MSQEVTRIKARIKSVGDSLKVTSAMKLVSTVKLKKWKNKMISNRNYAHEIELTTNKFLTYAKKYKTPLAEKNDAEKNLYIIVTSNLGLCGSYNNNIFKLADSLIKENDHLLIFGGKGVAHFQDTSNLKIDKFDPASDLSDSKIVSDLIKFVVNEYLNGEYKEIHLVYSSYKNSLVLLAKDVVVLPLNMESKEAIDFSPIFEPGEKELLDTLIPIYLKSFVYSRLLESEVCEFASRSNAMENATNNANELLDDLKIEFNKARQGAITQEIIEVVGVSKNV